MFVFELFNVLENKKILVLKFFNIFNVFYNKNGVNWICWYILHILYHQISLYGDFKN